MEEIVARLIEYGLLVVFANVFLEQVGVPIPALPTLVVAGALTARGRIARGLRCRGRRSQVAIPSDASGDALADRAHFVSCHSTSGLAEAPNQDGIA
jgi:hypothetical protein